MKDFYLHAPPAAGGFANLSSEYGNAGPTSRSAQRDDAKLLYKRRNSTTVGEEAL